LNAPKITQQSGATIDLQGGGDLHAYEFVPGTGGSQDRLAAGNVPGLYAILPAQQGQMAPFDPQESSSFGHTQTVYLSGIAGLPAGYYSLLPPRYALLPGASLVKIEPSYTSAVGGQIGALADGTPVVGGYLTSGTTGLHTGVTQYEGFAIYPGSYGQQLASYNISNASSYFTAAAAAADKNGAIPVPADAGTLNLDVLAALNNSLDLEGKVLTKAATGGRGALVNITAPDLEISSGGTGSGGITVSGSVLQSWNASILTFGGSTSADGSSIKVGATNVTVDSGVQLAADEILLVAQQGIDVKSGASLFSTSGRNGTTVSKLPEAAEVKLTNGAGDVLPEAALLAVSDLAVPVASRSTTSSSGAIGNTASKARATFHAAYLLAGMVSHQRNCCTRAVPESSGPRVRLMTIQSTTIVSRAIDSGAIQRRRSSRDQRAGTTDNGITIPIGRTRNALTAKRLPSHARDG